MKNLVPLCLVTICFLGVGAWRPGRPISLGSRHGQKSFPSGYSYKTLYLTQQLDHFGFANDQTFEMRYLLADQFWNRDGGPIFFYTGNEGDIEWFCNNTGFMWDIAPQFKALLVFAEHRYYGKSLPFGSETYKNASNLNYLTSEQALADFAELIRYLKTTLPGAGSSQVVAFGGSYGGMLAAWFRIKYPNLVIGSLAASAPIWQFTGLTPCHAFYDTTSETWLQASKTCVANVHQSYKTLEKVAETVWAFPGLGKCDDFLSLVSDEFNSTLRQCAENIRRGWYTIEATGSGMAGGYEFISNTFHTCKPLQSKYDLGPFMAFLADTYVQFAEVNYPYPASFLAPLPAWPVQVACGYLSKPLEGKELLQALAKVTNLFYNYTGEAKCINWTQDGSTGSLGYQGWNYQSCTEMVMPMCSNNTNMFYNMPWDFKTFSYNCYQQYKVRPRQDWISLQYWAKELKAASNIIFSNGLLDPWSSGGVMQSISDTVVAIQIPFGAHHLDLRAKNPKDTRDVVSAREQEENIIRQWLGITSM